MVETFEMLIALINDNSNLMIIKTLISKSVLRRMYSFNLSKSHIILHFLCYTFHN